MMEKIDWAAPIEPGRGMLGLLIGLSSSTVRALLGEEGVVATFHNSPELTVDYCKEGMVLLRAAALRECKYDWQNVVARLVFENEKLSSIIIFWGHDIEPYTYRGKLFETIGLGSCVSDLKDFCAIEYDDAEEVFFSDQWNGIEIGGTGACDLSKNPGQLIAFIRVYSTI